MELQVIMATTNRKKIEELNLDKKGIKENCLIINQILDSSMEKVTEEYKKNKIKIISFEERGLSKSRNEGLKNSEGEILLLTDDDVFLKKGFEKIIKDEFKKDPDLDILTFQTELPSGKKYKKYKEKEFDHNTFSLMKIMSIEFAVRRASIIENKIKYDERFGLGSIFQSGEENIFLIDCSRKKMKIKNIPIPLVVHEQESTGFIMTDLLLETKGAFCQRVFGNFGIIFAFLFCLKKFKGLKEVIKSFKLAMKGRRRFLRGTIYKRKRENV